ncbi:hypothetical protein [Prevotella sp. 10(H)]|uniref:hypothetical protein n=1 Tax=Prevotella sp. 10(H) TaxID=1158294 RepID=UPI0004A70EA9|nr:hypothetical protein [Prevotella sp. 10(H)]
MELDELKDTWHSLDERLKKQEMLKENILKEMLHAKSDKALGRLINFEFLGIILTIIVIPFMIFLITQGYLYFILQQVIVYLAIGYSILGIIAQIRKVYMLMKVDFSKPVSNNIVLIQRFNIQIRREKIASFTVIPLIGLFFVLPYTTLQMELWRWIAVVGVFVIVIILSYWQYKKIYDKNISHILKSLQELRDLEDDEKE